MWRPDILIRGIVQRPQLPRPVVPVSVLAGLLGADRSLLSEPDDQVRMLGVVPRSVVVGECLLFALRQASYGTSGPGTAPQVVVAYQDRYGATCKAKFLVERCRRRERV